MPQIEIVTDRKPWVNDAPQELGAVVDVSDEDAALMVERDFAIIVDDEPEAADAPKRGRPRKVRP